MKITKGKIVAPHLLLVYGIDGAGKSTFGANAPDAIFIGAESGTNNLDTSRFSDIKTYEDVIAALDYLMAEKHDYKSLVIDSLDWLEPLLYSFMLKKYKVDVVEECGGGFGKWVNIMLAEWAVIISKLSTIREVRMMNVILIGHSQIKVFNDPSSLDPYERYVLKLQDKTSAKFREFVDCVLFLNFETFVKKEKNMSKAKAFSDGERYIFTTKTVSYDAKNRFGLPAKIKLDATNPFVEFEKILKGSTADDLLLIKQEIEGMILDITDKELLPKVTSAYKNAKEYSALVSIRDRLIEITKGN